MRAKQSKAKQNKPFPNSYCLYKQEESARGHVEGKNICKATQQEGNQEQPPGFPNLMHVGVRTHSYRSTKAHMLQVYTYIPRQKVNQNEIRIKLGNH